MHMSYTNWYYNQGYGLLDKTVTWLWILFGVSVTGMLEEVDDEDHSLTRGQNVSMISLLATQFIATIRNSNYEFKL